MKNNSMTGIEPLERHPAMAPILAYWSYCQWYGGRNVPFAAVLESYRKRASGTGLPRSWIALESGFPVGMVSLKMTDLLSRTDIGPWLASLYVEGINRNRGLGASLIRTVVDAARFLGFADLFLFLGGEDNSLLESFYSRLGWFFFGDGVDNDGKPTKIYRFDLSVP